MALGDKIFSYCYKLETVNLPSGIPGVPFQMFWECQKLTAVVIPEGVAGISDKVFWNCYALSSVTLPDSLVSIGQQAFHACLNLETVTLSANVMEIDDTAFNDCEFLVMSAPEGSFAAQYAIDHNLMPEPVVLESAHPYNKERASGMGLRRSGRGGGPAGHLLPAHLSLRIVQQRQPDGYRR